jgi:methylglutaconyl-CoA hydratase
MTQTQPILELERRGAVATLWMNRADKHNAFDEALIAELTAQLRALGGDAQTSVIVLGGRGRSFSAGADVNWMRSQGQAAQAANEAGARRLGELFRTLANCPQTTVARVQGAAIGGGLGLVAACDIAIAAGSAVFAATEVRLGIIPAVISPYVIRAIGARQCQRYFQTAERIDAQRAFELGLVHEVVAPGQLDDALQGVVDALLAAGPQARRAAKELIHDVEGRPIDAALFDATARRIAVLRTGVEAQEGLSAFLGRREPAWAQAPATESFTEPPCSTKS